MEAAPIVPLAIFELQAVFSPPPVVWFSCGCAPECVFPGSAVCPLPSALLLNVVASKPKSVQASSFRFLQDIVVGGIGVDSRGQVPPRLLAEVLSVSPVLGLGVPQVAVRPILLPVLFAGFHALVLAAAKSSSSILHLHPVSCI